MLVWKFLTAGFTPDAWAAAGDQTVVPEARRVRVAKSPIRYSVVAYDGVGEDALPINDATAIDISIVKIISRRSVADPSVRIEENHQLASLAENNSGLEVDLGEYSEFDVDQADLVGVGIRSITVDTAPAIWVRALVGLEEAWT